MIIYTFVLITFMYLFVTFCVQSEDSDIDVNEAIDNIANGLAGIYADIRNDEVSTDSVDSVDDKDGETNDDNADDNEDAESEVTESEDTESEDIESEDTGNDDTSDSEEESEDHSLIEWFQNENPSLFKRRSILATFAGRAAGCIGADKERAYLGVLYSEIGVLVSRTNCEEEGIKMVKEKNLPDYYINVIESYKLKTSLPQSKEAVVVYLTLFLFNMYHFYNKESYNGPKVPMSSVVEKTFKLRLNDGSFDNSSLTIDEYNRLKQYYIDYFKARD